MVSDTEITKVRIVIRHLLWQIREVRKDRDAAWKWVNRFANTLQYQDLEQDPDQYALAILAEARSFNNQKKRNQQMRWVREQLAKEGVTSPTQEQLDDKWLEMYGNETTADASEGDGEVNPDGQQATQAEAGTPDNHYGPRQPASTRSAAAKHSVEMPSIEQLYDFAAAEGLDEADARDWFEMTVVERDGNDRNGKPIVNWKGACKRFCTARAKARNKDGENQ